MSLDFRERLERDLSRLNLAAQNGWAKLIASGFSIGIIRPPRGLWISAELVYPDR